MIVIVAMPAMSENDWASVAPEFRKEEFAHPLDPNAYAKIDRSVVLLLHEMRKKIGMPFIIHEAAAPHVGHAPNSYHYPLDNRLALAVDFHIEGLSLIEQFVCASAYPWTAIGLYPFWRNPGLHVDLRPLRKGRIIWLRNKDGKYILLTDIKEFFNTFLKTVIKKI